MGFYYVLNLFLKIFIMLLSFIESYIRINTLVYIYFGIDIKEYEEYIRETMLNEFYLIFMSGDVFISMINDS